MFKLNRKNILFLAFFYVFIPISVYGQIKITEIMYDPEGTDTGREWIEIYNSGSETVDLSSYKLFETNVNHKLSLFGATEAGPINVSAGKWAIIADNPEKFKIDFPSYSGILIDSVFSLNNTGESLSIINAEGTVVDFAEYSVDLGANSTGNSLQKNSQDIFIPAKPTAGIANSETPADETLDSDNSESSSDNSDVSNSTSSPNTSSSSSSSSGNSAHSSQSDLTNYKEKIDLAIGAGRNRIGTILTPVEFFGNFNTEKTPKFLWSMGDGTIEKGRNITHIYENPGEYNVILNGVIDKEQATSRTKIKIYAPNVEILSIIDGKDVDISVKNVNKQELNLGNYKLSFGDQNFIIPADTIISGNSEIIFSSKITGFKIDSKFTPAKIRYSTGKTLAEEALSIENRNKIFNLILQNI